MQDLRRGGLGLKNCSLGTRAGSDGSDLVLLRLLMPGNFGMRRALNRRLLRQQLRRRRHERRLPGVICSLHDPARAFPEILLQRCVLLLDLRNSPLLFEDLRRMQIRQARYMQIADVLHVCLDSSDQ